MMSSYPDSARERLGSLLIRRRHELDPRYRNREFFAKETGVHWRVLYEIERSKRDNFTDLTLAAVEVAYRLRRGSIARMLAGGDLEPLEDTPPRGPGEPRSYTPEEVERITADFVRMIQARTQADDDGDGKDREKPA
jgi:hypothetical protein